MAASIIVNLPGWITTPLLSRATLHNTECSKLEQQYNSNLGIFTGQVKMKDSRKLIMSNISQIKLHKTYI